MSAVAAFSLSHLCSHISYLKHISTFKQILIIFAFFSLFADMQQPMNVMTQNFAAVNLNPQPNMMPVRPQTSPLMGGSIPVGMGMPSVMPGTMGMTSMGPMPMLNQGTMGMNMNMGVPATGMGLTGAIGMGITNISMTSMTPGTVQPKQDAFANFANFSK